MLRCPECGSECLSTDLACPSCGAYVPSPVPFLPVWEMAGITVLAPWAYALSTVGVLALGDSVAPQLMEHPPALLAAVFKIYAWIAPFAILALAGYYGYRRRTLARISAVVFGWLFGGVIQIGAAFVLLALGQQSVDVIFLLGMAVGYSAVAVLVAAIGSAVASARSRQRGN